MYYMEEQQFYVLAHRCDSSVRGPDSDKINPFNPEIFLISVVMEIT